MTNKFIIISLLGLVNVYCETPCSHNVLSEPNLSEASNVVSKYEPVPAAQELLNREYLPPVAFDFAIPQANQAQPVYVAPPQPTPAIPKLQPLPQATFVKPVYQPLPKLQPLPQPTYVKPVYQPLPKLQPLPQATNVKPVYQPHPPPQPLPKLQPRPSTAQPKYVPQPLPKLQPFFSTPRPVITQTLSPSTLKPLSDFPKLAFQPASKFNSLPPLKPIQPFSSKQIVPPKSYQSRDNEIPQATNVLPKLAKPDLEPAAQTNRFSVVNTDKIKINHYICEQGNAQQKFLCDIWKLWDVQHPPEITSNDLDNPGDNSDNRPTYAQLPTSPTPTSTTTTTTTPKPERDIENLAGDSQQNINAIEYLPPYSTTLAPSSTTAAPTTVEIPKRVVAPSNDNINVIKPEDTTVTPTTTTVQEGYDYPKPSIPFPVPEKEGYEYPKPSIPFSDGISYSSFSSVPLSSFNSPASTFGSSLSLENRFSDGFNQFPSGFSPLVSYSDSLQYQPLVSSPIVTSTTIAPDLFFKSNSEFFRSPSFSYTYQPLQQPINNISPFNAPAVSYSDQTLSTISPYSFSTPAPPAVSYTSQPAFSQSLSTLAPLLLSKESLSLTSTSQPPTSQTFTTTESPIKSSISTEKPTATYTTSTPLPASYNSQPIGQYVNSFSPYSYSFPSFDQSFSTISPLNYNFDNSLSGFNSFNYQPFSGQSFSNIPSYYYSQSSSTESPIEVKNQISSEKSTVTTTSATPVVNSNFESQQFGQYFNFPTPSANYYFQPIEQSVIPSSPFIYNYDQSLGLRSNYTSLNYQPLSGQPFSAPSPISYNFQPQSFLPGQTYNFPSSFSSGLSQSQFISSESPATTYTSSNPPSFNFQTYTSTSAPQPLRSFGSSSESQTGQSSFSGLNSFQSGLSQSVSSESPATTYTSSNPPSFNFQTYTSTSAPQPLRSFGSFSESQTGQSSSSYPKSGLSFGSQAQSVADLKDLQATAKESSLDLKFGGSQGNGLFGDSPRKSGEDSKEDISLGNIEILKVKRKSSLQNQ